MKTVKGPLDVLCRFLTLKADGELLRTSRLFVSEVFFFCVCVSDEPPALSDPNDFIFSRFNRFWIGAGAAGERDHCEKALKHQTLHMYSFKTKCIVLNLDTLKQLTIHLSWPSHRMSACTHTHTNTHGRSAASEVPGVAVRTKTLCVECCCPFTHMMLQRNSPLYLWMRHLSQLLGFNRTYSHVCGRETEEEKLLERWQGVDSLKCYF